MVLTLIYCLGIFLAKLHIYGAISAVAKRNT
jgi:hypothetical protein